MAGSRQVRRYSQLAHEVMHVSGVVGESGFRGALLAGQGDGDVLQWAERAGDPADAEAGLVLH